MRRGGVGLWLVSEWKESPNPIGSTWRGVSVSVTRSEQMEVWGQRKTSDGRRSRNNLHSEQDEENQIGNRPRNARSSFGRHQLNRRPCE